MSTTTTKQRNTSRQRALCLAVARGAAIRRVGPCHFNVRPKGAQRGQLVQGWASVVRLLESWLP